MMNSNNTGSYENQEESIYEDPDTLLGADGGQSQVQSEVKVKPVPQPRIKSQMVHQQNKSSTAGSLGTSHSTIIRPSSQSLKELRPVRRPPPPPPPPKVPTKTPFAVQTASKSSYYSKNIPEPPAQLRDVKVEKKPPPLPPRSDIPCTSPHYAGRAPSARSQTSEVKATNRSSRAGLPQSQNQTGSLLRNTSGSQLSLQSRRSSYAPSSSSIPSELNGYNFREFPPYTDVIPDESSEMSCRMPMHQSNSDFDTIYQLTADDISKLLQWLRRVCDQRDPLLYGLGIQEEISSFNQKAFNVRKARRLYNLLMMKRKQGFEDIIKEFKSICEKLDKVKKTNKNMGIAGGTTGAVGGVAAVVGIALAPITMGTSLIATAVGAGMVASAGGFGVKAAIANKKTVNRATMEKLVNDYKSNVADIELCLQFILYAMNELQKYDIGRLHNAGAHTDALRMAELSHNVLRNMSHGSGMSPIQPGGLISGSLLKGFGAEIDEFFTEKNNQKLKKSNKSKFAGRLSSLTKALREQLEYLIKMWELLQ